MNFNGPGRVYPRHILAATLLSIWSAHTRTLNVSTVSPDYRAGFRDALACVAMALDITPETVVPDESAGGAHDARGTAVVR